MSNHVTTDAIEMSFISVMPVRRDDPIETVPSTCPRVRSMDYPIDPNPIARAANENVSAFFEGSTSH